LSPGVLQNVENVRKPWQKSSSERPRLIDYSPCAAIEIGALILRVLQGRREYENVQMLPKLFTVDNVVPTKSFCLFSFVNVKYLLVYS
jgi:hypothetical protein